MKTSNHDSHTLNSPNHKVRPVSKAKLDLRASLGGVPGTITSLPLAVMAFALQPS